MNETLIPYPNPDYNDENLLIKEIANGSIGKISMQEMQKGRGIFERYSKTFTTFLIDNQQLEANDIVPYDLAKIKEMAWLPYFEENKEKPPIIPIHNDYARILVYGKQLLPEEYNENTSKASEDAYGIYIGNSDTNKLYYLNLEDFTMALVDDGDIRNYDYYYGCLIDNSDNKVYRLFKGKKYSTSYNNDTTINIFSNKTYGTYLIQQDGKLKVVNSKFEDYYKSVIDSKYNLKTIAIKEIEFDGTIDKYLQLKNTPYIEAGNKKYFIVYNKDNDCFELKETNKSISVISKYDFLYNMNYYFKKTGFKLKTEARYNLPKKGFISRGKIPETDDIINVNVRYSDDTDKDFTMCYTNSYMDGNIFIASYNFYPRINGIKYSGVKLFGGIKYNAEENKYYFEFYKYGEQK